MGVWIETMLIIIFQILNSVTPCVGVWIETLLICLRLLIIVSHPAWVCGLKLIANGNGI